MAIIIRQKGNKPEKLDKSTFDREDSLQKFIYDNPESIPLYDIKEDIRLLILAREFSTQSGPIDAIGIDKDGEIYIVETKLYKNPDKRTVVAQSLDYGAALWKHSTNFEDFIRTLNENVQRSFKISLEEKIQEHFGLSDDEMVDLLDSVKNNLSDGILHFVILMDSLDDRMKDLILYVNKNSQFDIYAVELEYYKKDSNEIFIPRIYGGEVKKDLTSRNAGKQWNWALFEKRLREIGEKEVKAAKQILDWAGDNNIEIYWSPSLRGSFILCFYNKDRKGFYPFSITGDAMISWNAPHQKKLYPTPFSDIEKRKEILNRLKSIKEAVVDTENVDGYNGFKLPLRAIANEDARRDFFAVCMWVKKTIETK